MDRSKTMVPLSVQSQACCGLYRWPCCRPGAAMVPAPTTTCKDERARAVMNTPACKKGALDEVLASTSHCPAPAKSTFDGAPPSPCDVPSKPPVETPKQRHMLSANFVATCQMLCLRKLNQLNFRRITITEETMVCRIAAMPLLVLQTVCNCSQLQLARLPSGQLLLQPQNTLIRF